MNTICDVAGKVVIITGAAGGIGRALVEGFADAGATVIAADLAEDAVKALADESGDGNVSGVALDVADQAQLTQLGARSLFGGDFGDGGPGAGLVDDGVSRGAAVVLSVRSGSGPAARACRGP